MTNSLQIAINYHHVGKLPAEWETLSETAQRGWWRVFNGQFENVTLAPRALADAIRAGHAYTAQHAGYRKSDNFLQAQHLALDFDTNDIRSTFAELVKYPIIKRYAAFLHTTPSHTAAAPRARAVFILDRPIADAGKYALLAESLVHRFGTADQSCKDAARFYFGAVGCAVHWLGNVLTLETAAAELVNPFRESKNQRQRATVSAHVTDAADVPGRILRRHAAKLLDRVQHAPDGEKYITLRDVSITLGGYVAGGYYNLVDVTNWLQDAIRRNSGNVKSLRVADDCIADSLQYGMARPLRFELQTAAPAAEPETPAATIQPDRSWRETAVSAWLQELEALISELPSGDPSWSAAATQYAELQQTGVIA